LTLRETIRANCYMCACMTEREDCKTALCAFYPFMVYNPNRISYTTKQGPLRKKDGESFADFLKRQDERHKLNADQEEE